MLVKKKSVIVALISGFVLSCVLILTLVGYVAYTELKNEESKISYRRMLGRLNAGIYGKFIEIGGLEVRSDESGALHGKNIVEGTLKNCGEKDVSEILLKLKFFDMEGAIIYEALLDPLGPALGSGGLSQVGISHLLVPDGTFVQKGRSIFFKKILVNCPEEITSSMKPIRGYKARQKWPGKISYEILSLKLSDPKDR